MNRRLYKIVVWGSVLVTLGLWLGSKWYYQDWFVDWEKYPAKGASLSATVLMVWALVLSTRARFLETWLGGLDKVYQAHKMVGKWSFFLILLHPFFLFVRELRTSGFDWRFWVWQEMLSNYDFGHNVGLFAFYLMIALIAVTLWVGLPYHLWKKTHEWFGLLIVLVLGHVFLVGGDVSSYPLLKYWMYGSIILGIVSYIYIGYLYYLVGPKHEYTISDIEKLEDVVEINFVPKGRGMDYQPSQYVYIKFDRESLDSEYHPFSIASSHCGDGCFKLGIKKLGDYTNQLGQLEKGDTAHVMGPYGRFSDKFLIGDRPCIFVGGGIGITPFMGMWDQALNSPDKRYHQQADGGYASPRVNLFYSVANASDASFDNDVCQCVIKSKFRGFEALEDRGHTYELHDVSKDGYFTSDYIAEQVPDYKDCYIFLCGPGPMMKSLINGFIKKGVPKSRIITEDFNMLPKYKWKLLK